MSDIFTLFDGGYEAQRQLDRQAQQASPGDVNKYLSERDERRNAEVSELRQKNDRAQQLRKQYGFDYSVSQFAALANAIDNKIITEDQGYDLLAAQTISDNLKRQGVDIHPLEIYENLPVYQELVLGRPNGQSARTPKTNLAAIGDSFIISAANMKKNFLGLDLSHARSIGNEKLEQIVMERIRLENKTIEERGDYQKRNFFVEAGKYSAKSSVYTAFVMAGGLLGSIGGIGGIGAFAAGWMGATGQAYLGLDAAGVKHEIAGPLSIAMGAVNAIIESQLGNAAGLVGRATGAGTLQSAFAKRAAAFISDKLHLSGTALKMATGPVARYLLEGVGELSEEVFQEISDIVGEELAAFLQKEGVHLDRENYVKRVAEAAKGGFMAFLFMGIPGLSIDTVGSISDYKSLRTDADTIPSEQMFKERHKDSPLRGDMTDEEWNKELSKIHNGRQGIREREEAKHAEELKATAGLGEGYAEQKYNEDGTPIPLGETYRRKSGLLHTELDEKRGLFKIGDPRVEGQNNLYSHIGYKLDDDGTVRINEFKVRNDMDTAEFRQEAFERFTETFAGHEIEWDAKTTREAEIREDLIRNNPYGEQAGLKYYSQEDTERVGDARFRNRVIDNFKRHFPQMENAEHAVMAAEWEHFADMNGVSLEEYVTREFGGLEKAFTANANSRIDAAMKEGADVKGAVTFDGLARDARAVIYLSKNADLTTFIHEMGHIYRRRLQGDMLAKAEQLWGVTDGKWTTAQEEQFTEDLERWRREGKAPSPEMQTFFEKFAEFLKKLVNAVSQRSEVSPEIKEFFDTLYAGEKGADIAAESAGTAQKGRVTAQTGKYTAAGAQAAPEASTAQYEANKKLHEERDTLQKNTGKGNAKPLQTGVETVEQLLEKAKNSIPKLKNWEKEIKDFFVKNLGIELEVVWRPTDKKNPLPLKSAKSIQRKLDKGDTIAYILDVMGITLVAKNYADLVKVTEELRRRDDVIRIKDRYKTVDDFGYRDILCNVKLDNGMIAEVQVNVPQMLAAKEEFGGHKYYDIARDKDDYVKAGHLTEEQANEDWLALARMSKIVYDAANQAVLGESLFNASSLEMLQPSLYEEQNALNRDGESVLSSFTRNMMSDLGLSANTAGYTSPSAHINRSEGSSNDGTSTAGLEETALSTGAAEAGTTESSFISVPSTINIAQKTNSVNSKSENISEKNSPENEKRKAKAKAKWEAAERVIGAEDQVTLQTGEEITGHFELGEAGISTPSHDPDADFTNSEGFPANENGTSMNVGRDYTGGFSRQAALTMAAGFDQRGTGIIVDNNGVTSSGNNRDISRRIAAKGDTDGKYINYLKSRPERWGFTQADIAKFKHPTVYFVVNAPAVYTPLYFDQFNRSGKKSTSPMETAIKLTHLIKTDMVREFSAALGDYDSISELYADTQAATEIFKSLMKRGIVAKNSYPDYVETITIKGKQHERVTEFGKEFLESVMLGAVLEEDSIRTLSLSPEIRKRVVKALAALVDNAALGEYCVISEINRAIAIAVEVQTNKKNYKGIEDYANQAELDLGQRVSTDIEVELAGRLLEKTEYAFADMMGGLNAVLQEEARGQSDMFGDTSKDDILRRYLGVKAKADAIKDANNKIIESKDAAGLDRVKAAMDNAGLAKGEADGTYFQAAYHGSPYRFNRFDSSHMGEGEGAQAYGWGHYFAGKKEVAEWYRKNLKRTAYIYKGEQYVENIEGNDRLYRSLKTGKTISTWRNLTEDSSAGNLYDVFEWLRFFDGDKKYIKDRIERGFKFGRLNENEYKEQLAILDEVKVDKGQLYEVDIPGDEEMLDWDNSISDDKLWSKIAEALCAIYNTDSLVEVFDGKMTMPDGYEVYNKFSRKLGSDKAASQYLNSLGIKGIRYLDGSSRADGEGSYNYVIFDDNDIEITQTFFQLDDGLIEDAAQFDNWREFRDAYEADGTLFQAAYHGSPHRFDRFDSSHMGEGEGYQAFGYGHYFASKKEVAEHYREALAEPQFFSGDRRLRGDEELAASFLFDISGKRVTSEEAIKQVKKMLIIEKQKVLIPVIEKLSNEDLSYREGQLYEVDIPGDDEMLDWEKSLDEQPEKVKEALESFIHDPSMRNFLGVYNGKINHNVGKYIYNGIALRFEVNDGLYAPQKYKAASQYLNSLGIKGIRYLDGSSRDAGEGTHNYVIFDDNDINITQTFFQQEKTANDAWYRSLYNDAKKIHKNTLFQEEKTSRAGELDKRFYNEADRKYLTEALKELYRVHNDQSLEPTEEEGGEAREEYRRIKRLQRRIETELPNAGSIIGMAAQVRSGRALSSGQYDRLKSLMRKNTRDFRAVLADIMGQEEFLESLADEKDGEPAGRLADPRPDRQNVKERLKEIAKIIRETDPALAAEIESGEASYGDPRITAFEAGVEAEYEKAKAALEGLEKETGEDYARLANDAQKRIVDAYDKMLEARGKLDSTNERLRRMTDEEGKIAEPYLRRQRLEESNYSQAIKAYNDLVSMLGMDAQVREAIARREARASERATQTGIRRRQRALRALKEIRGKLVRRITRKISLDTVAYKYAETAKAIQKIFTISAFEDINKWLDPEEREILRGVWSQWSTDEEFRDALTEQVSKRKKNGVEEALRIKNILGKSWEKITVAEKRTLHRLLPRTNLVMDLFLKELLEENEDSVPLDIDGNYVDGKVQLLIGDELKQRFKDTLGDELLNRIINKPLNDWSLAEAEELARVIDKLTVEGKKERAAQKEARRVLEQEYRDKILDALENTGVVIGPDDTPEEKERKQKEKNRILKKFAGGKRNNILNNFFDANLRRFTTALDGGRKGIFTNLLYWAENDAYNEEQRRIAARRLVIDTVMEKNHITLDELYSEVKIPELEGLDLDLYEVSKGKITVDDLLYIMRGYQNEETRQAIMYGNLSSAAERNRNSASMEKIEEFHNVAHGRMMLILSYAKEFFAKEENKKFMELYEAIGADYDRNGERLNRACIDMFNKPMWRVENYVPMNRREHTGAENENRVIEDLLGVSGAGMKWVNRGMTVKREKISPGGQRPIELGLYKTWAQSVNSTEHLLAYGPMVQTLNAVFKGFHASEVRSTLQKRWGKAASDRIGDTIAEFANPEPTRQRHALDNVVRGLRGKTATAYLAWKTSGILKQLATSPWPYLQEINPRDYIAACLEVAGGRGKANDLIREKSIYMKNRDFDPMVKLIREAREKNDSAFLSGLDKFNALGMKGLEWVDWICVAPGWLAVYKNELGNIAKEQRAEYEKLLEKYQGSEYADVLPTMESKANRALAETMSEEQQDAEAVARADDAVRRMQPSSRAADLAPLFKGRNEVTNALLQFQTALNVIWQNIRYDLPLAVKNKQVMTVAGMVTGYMMAGICMGMLSEIGNDDDDDDDEEKTARKIIFYSLTQFTDAVPVIGEGVTRATEQFITGKKSYSGQQDILPVVRKALGGAGNIAGALWEKDPEKRRQRYIRAVRDVGEAVAIRFGAPVSGVKELGRAAGIGDGDGDLDLYWQALLGQRNK